MSGFYRVQSEELGVVLRFGKYVRDADPGLNYHLPYPIETVLLPKALNDQGFAVSASLGLTSIVYAASFFGKGFTGFLMEIRPAAENK